MLLKFGSLMRAASLCLLFVCTILASPSSPNPTRLTRNVLYDDDVNSDHGVVNKRFVWDMSYDEEERENCSDIQSPSPEYNGSSCELVLAECNGKYELFNYLSLVVCGLGKPLQVSDTYTMHESSV